MKPGLPAPDFLRPVARPGRLAWAWCVTALLVLATSLAEAHATWQQRQQALDRLARGSQAAPPATTATPTARAGTPVASRGGTAIARGPAPARQAEAAAWQAQLALPWPTVWAASEAAADGIQWLLIDHGAAGLRLSGLAASTAAADAAADALRAAGPAGAGAWQGVALASVERVPEGQRFELVARLAAVGAAVGATAEAAR